MFREFFFMMNQRNFQNMITINTASILDGALLLGLILLLISILLITKSGGIRL